MVEKTAKYEYLLDGEPDETILGRPLNVYDITYRYMYKVQKFPKSFLMGSSTKVLSLIDSCFLVFFFRIHSYRNNKKCIPTTKPTTLKMII